MQVPVKMPTNHESIADTLRKKYFGPLAEKKDYRNAFVFGESVRLFDDAPEVLVEYLSTDEERIQRNYSLRVDLYQKLITLSQTIDAPVSSVYRAIVMYSLKSAEASSYSRGNNSEVRALVKLLEKQIADCTETLNKIKEMM